MSSAGRARSTPYLVCSPPRSVPCTHSQDQWFVMARLEVQLLALFGSKLANVASVADCGMRIGADGLAAVVMTRADLSHSQVWVELAAKRKHGFALERAVFLTVLHRIFISGSDRAADRWRDDCAIADVDGLDLHHLYRAMAWLGEELPDRDQEGRTALYQGHHRRAAVCAPARSVHAP